MIVANRFPEVVKIRFNLANPVSTSMYTYLEQKATVKVNKPERRTCDYSITRNYKF
jgi:hypothetical protein